MVFLHLDCRHYLGDRPCRFHRLCEGCPHYAPMGPRVLIIKLGALGDVLRTSCLLGALRARSEPPYVTLVTSPAARPLVERMPGVDRALSFDPTTHLILENEQFDTVISLDKDPAPCALAMRIHTGHRLGIGLSRHGTVQPLNEECDDYFRLGLDNEEKFHRNQKTYQQLIYEALGWHHQGQGYTFELNAEDQDEAQRRLDRLGVTGDEPIIGLLPGAGSVFAHKAWREDGYVELVERLSQVRQKVRYLLLGGPEDRELLNRVAMACRSDRLFYPGPDIPLGPFAGLIERCRVVVSGDTLAMHLAVALGRRVVAIFGPTCPQEIDLFGRGEKIVSSIDCAPCYLRHCEKSPHCQDLITTEIVERAIRRQLDAAAMDSSQPADTVEIASGPDGGMGPGEN